MSQSNQISLGLIGSPTDARMKYLYQYLETAYPVLAYWNSSDEIPDWSQAEHIFQTCNVILVPTPFSSDQSRLHQTALAIDRFLSALTLQHTLIGGALSNKVRLTCEQHGISYYDLMDQLQVAAKNAVATAEGLLAEMICHTPDNLQGKHILMVGYGRCGQAAAFRLRAMGGAVSIGLRASSDSCAKAWCDGFPVITLETLGSTCTTDAVTCSFDAIVNTVPQPILTPQHLSALVPEGTIYEIASAPGGMTPEALQQYGTRTKKLPGLPGRYSPKTSAEILGEVIFQLLA